MEKPLPPFRSGDESECFHQVGSRSRILFLPKSGTECRANDLRLLREADQEIAGPQTYSGVCVSKQRQVNGKTCRSLLTRCPGYSQSFVQARWHRTSH